MTDLSGSPAGALRLSAALTFGGSGLDRAAHMRGDPAALAAAWAHPGARVLPLWRDKPLVTGSPVDGLGWLAVDQPGLTEAGPPIFLGLDAGAAPRFAVDLSGWTPEVPPEGPLDGFLDQSEQVHPLFPGDTRFAELRACMTRLSARDAELAATARALTGWHARHGFCAKCGAASLPAQAGWQRDCPACGAHHFPRTDPVVIMLVTRGNAVLMGRSPGWPEKMYSLLAGFVEPGETLEAAVRREVFEEAGVRVGRVDYIVSQPWPFPASLMMACRGEALSAEITIDPAEIEEARWVSREEMVEAHLGTHPEITAARPGAVARYVVERWLADETGAAPVPLQV
ncbi:NAD(+) diphosphatase [Meridianimarinicoccus roseus]|uniref:NAD(+) diphosphatase n=1 Tax=Meridianimarinicoccus roseus TaxID=2072018 RepID=UPI001EE688EE|nr:NAD(+) diphosphatase [Meridianimarinicoccus roseus]